MQIVAKENSQAAFRLAQSRAALRVDEMPQLEGIWDLSEWLLAEAETLVLMSSAAGQTTDVPLKLKVIEAADQQQTVRYGQWPNWQRPWYLYGGCAMQMVLE